MTNLQKNKKYFPKIRFGKFQLLYHKNIQLLKQITYLKQKNAELILALNMTRVIDS